MSEVSLASSTLPLGYRHAARTAGLAGAVSLAATFVLWISIITMHRRWPQGGAAFYKGYLFAWLFFLSVSLGAMAAVMVHHLVGGEWGYFVRRFGEAAANVMPLLFVLFIPILIGLRQIYPWADPGNHDPFVVHKKTYLNPAFFILRYIIYFAAWIVTARLLRKLSLEHDRTANAFTERKMRVVSAIGLVIYFITMSLGAIDWIMSMEPQWYSTIFGLIVCVSQAVIGMAMLIIMLDLLSAQRPFAGLLQAKHFNDLATLLITAIILWAYHAFSQLLVTWMGNVQDEIIWYVKRNQGVWHLIFVLLIFVGFLAPFVLLLQRGIKKRGKAMRFVCWGVLVMQALYLYWTIAPSGGDPFPEFEWFNALVSIVALVGIGGLWIAVFLWLLDGPPLMPMGGAVPIGLAPPRGGAEPGVSTHGVQPAT